MAPNWSSSNPSRHEIHEPGVNPLPKTVKIVEVGPRDGLQNEPAAIATATKVELIARLGKAGLRTIETTSFVAPKWVPQMADNAVVMRAIERLPGVAYPRADAQPERSRSGLGGGCAGSSRVRRGIRVFLAKNINCSIADSLKRFEPVMAAARQAGVQVRGYVSCVLGCPYEGPVQPAAVAQVADTLFDMGCHEISLGDTIGVGTPEAAKRLIETVGARIPIDRIAGHYHDTYGMAIANIYASLQCGVTVFDASVAGLGGCPTPVGRFRQRRHRRCRVSAERFGNRNRHRSRRAYRLFGLDQRGAGTFAGIESRAGKNRPDNPSHRTLLIDGEHSMNDRSHDDSAVPTFDRPLWTPDPVHATATRMAAFTAYSRQVSGRALASYADLHAWSIDAPEQFWSAVWDFCGVRGERGERVLIDPQRMPGAHWFPDARLNFAENLLRDCGNPKPWCSGAKTESSAGCRGSNCVGRSLNSRRR